MFKEYFKTPIIKSDDRVFYTAMRKKSLNLVVNNTFNLFETGLRNFTLFLTSFL